MLKIVFDTNIIVSAHLRKNSLPAILLSLALEDKARIVISKDILEEYIGVLSRKKFDIPQYKSKESISLIKKHSKTVIPDELLDISQDKGDNKFLECAFKSGAHFLITGNKKHYPKEFKGTKIVSPQEFIDYLLADLNL